MTIGGFNGVIITECNGLSSVFFIRRPSAAAHMASRRGSGRWHTPVIPAHNHVIPTPNSVIPAHNHVIPTPTHVIPA